MAAGRFDHFFFKEHVMKILLAVDGSPYTKKMLGYLTTHLEVFSPSNEYLVFTAVVPLPGRASAVIGKEALKSYHVEQAEKVLGPVGKFLARHGINAKSDWKAAMPGAAIAKAAQDGSYDLVMMGSHGHGALTNLVMGSVATQVLAHCAVPVLLVR